MENTINNIACCNYLIYVEDEKFGVCDTIRIFHSVSDDFLLDKFDNDFISSVKFSFHCVSQYLLENFYIIHRPDFKNISFINCISKYIIRGKSVGFAAAIAYLSYITGLNVPNNIAVTGYFDENCNAVDIEYLSEKINEIKENRADIKQILITAGSLKNLLEYDNKNWILDNVEILGVDNISELFNIVFGEQNIASKILQIPCKTNYFFSQYFLISELNKCFFGRNDIIEYINNFVNSNNNGICAVIGKPGSGKSALAANLIKINNLPHHFFTLKIKKKLLLLTD